MNQQIQELAKRAEEFSHWTNDGCTANYRINTVKFAELIVRECIQAVDNVGGYNEEFHMNAIKEHFGVEE
jgi:hypothetical protein